MNRLSITFALIVAGLTAFSATPAHAQEHRTRTDIRVGVGSDRGGFSIRIGTGSHDRRHDRRHDRPVIVHRPSPPVIVIERPCPPPVIVIERPVPVCHPSFQVEVQELTGYVEEKVAVEWDTQKVFVGYKDEPVVVGYRMVTSTWWDGCHWQFSQRRVEITECRPVAQYEYRQVPVRFECRRVPQYRTVTVTATWHDAYQCYGYYDCHGVFQRVQR